MEKENLKVVTTIKKAIQISLKNLPTLIEEAVLHTLQT